MKEELYNAIEDALRGTGVKASYVMKKVLPLIEKSFQQGQIFAYHDVFKSWKMIGLQDENVRKLLYWCEINANQIAREIK